MNGPKKLNLINAEKNVTIIALRGGKEFNQKIVSMGIHIGAELTVIEAEPPRGGAMLIGVNGTRLMLGHGMAKKIFVREL
jgi:Fe2+ transport system protein FeoA